MADVDASGFVTSTRGQVIALLNTAQTEASEEETKQRMPPRVAAATEGFAEGVITVGSAALRA